MIEGRIQSQTLAAIQNNDREAARPPAFYKGIIFDTVTVLAALSAGYVYSGFLAGSESATFFLCGLGIFLICATLQVIFTDSLLRRLSMIAIEIIAFLIFFYKNMDFSYLAAAALILYIFYVWGTVAGRRELTNGVRIRFMRIARVFLGKMITGLAIVLLIFYVPHWNSKNVFLPEDQFQMFYTSGANIARGLYSQFNLTSSVAMFAEGLVKMQFESKPEFNTLPPGNQQTAIANATPQVIKNMSDRLGITLTPEESMEKAVYDAIMNTLTDWQTRLGAQFMLIWLIAVFFILRSLGLLYGLLIAFISLMIYEIFLAADIVRVVSEPVSKEVIGM